MLNNPRGSGMVRYCNNVLKDLTEKISNYVSSDSLEELTIAENRFKNLGIKIGDKFISLYSISRSIQGIFLTSELLETLWGRVFMDWLYLRNGFGYLYEYLFEREKLEFVMDHLKDDLSKKIFCDFIKLNILHVFAGVNYLASETAFQRFEKTFDIIGIKNKKMVDYYIEAIKNSPSRPYSRDSKFSLINTPNGEIVVDLSSPGVIVSIIQSFYMRQYYHPMIKPNKGDVVFDLGAFDGITTLSFALSGSDAVYAFEPNKEMVNMIDSIMNYNRVSSKVEIVPLAVDEKSGAVKLVERSGPAGNFTLESGSDSNNEVAATSLDDFVQQNQISKVDFIKLDIEGAEIRALRGGKNVLKKFHPKLAISIYHRPEDPYEILNFLLESGYRDFYLSHKWQSTADVVMFAI